MSVTNERGWLMVVRKSDGALLDTGRTHALQDFDELPADFPVWCGDGEGRAVVVRRDNLAHLDEYMEEASA